MAVTSSKRVGRNSFTMRRTNDWVMSADVPTDVTVDVCGTTFSLHKFPLVSRCGKIRKLVAEARDPELSRIELTDVPGGSEAFELAAKFCYGINFDITASSAAMLRCVGEYLEMTDDYGNNNLVTRAEAFIGDVVLHSLGNAITVLHACEKLLPAAEDLGIVNRCVQAVGTKACQEQTAAAVSKSSSFGKRSKASSSPLEWWAEEISILGLDFYQRVLEVMKSQGMPQECLWGSLMHYAQRALKSPVDHTSDKQSTAAMEHEQRMLVETIVRLLPSEKNSASCSFLFGLLRTAIVLDTTVTCRLELERRIALQMEDANLDDLLIPSFSYTADTIFDTDIVHRIVSSFFQQQQLQVGKSLQTAITKVAKLLDSYLSEVAPDANLKLNKFISLAELLPEEARTIHDGLYRAVDIYFKSHPSLAEPERRRVCKLLDSERLSQEACTHAAQNERLPAHFIIQVLYFEQLRLKNVVANFTLDVQNERTPSRRMSISGAGPAVVSPRPNDQVALRKENRELKIELSKMKNRLSDLEKDGVFRQEESSPRAAAVVGTTGGGKLFQSFSRRLGRLNPFGKSSLSKPPPTPEYQKPRRRRHSIS